MSIKVEAIEAAQEMARQQGVDISSGKMMLILGSFLEAGGYALPERETSDPYVENDPEHADRMKIFDAYSKLVSIRRRIAIVEAETAELPKSEDDFQYEKLYSYLFRDDDSPADEITAVLAGLDRQFPDYYDPDTTYKEDAEAYIEAVEKLIEGLRKEVSGEIEPEEPHWTMI